MVAGHNGQTALVHGLLLFRVHNESHALMLSTVGGSLQYILHILIEI